MEKETGASRRFDAVIIDEVDSMLIDDNNTLARLADQLPGMEWLNPLLFGIWSSIDSDKQAESKRDTIIDNARKLLTDPKSDLKLPTHLVHFVHDSIPTWVDHALLAKFEYRLDHHYMIKPDDTRTKRIMPIDFSNTGVVQPSTTWSDGLHQFLQIKHGLKMTALTVTTNYLSNMGLFTRYGKNIFGLTGTIGSEGAQKLLHLIYGVDTVIIPSFKQKRHIQLKTTLAENDDEWLQTIVVETISNARRQRGILVICETRLDAKTISKQLQRADPSCVVRLYTDNTDAVESDVVGNRIQPGEIIVATNLAGRGTDLKTSPAVEKNGGLHVCLTFLSNNLRVEEQAFGRTSRQGNRGTSHMILSRDRALQQLLATDPEYVNTPAKKFNEPIDFFCDWREHAERAHLDRMYRDEIVDIKLKDELFKRFCQLLDKLRKKNDNAYRLLSVKEQWGLWLKSMDYETQNRLALRLFLEKQSLRPEDVQQDGHSFFHALARQLDGQLTGDQIKSQVIQHMVTHADSYTNVTDEERHQAASEALNINLIIYRTDSRRPHVYQQEEALHTCVIGYEVGSYYFAVRSNESNETAKEPAKNKGSRRQQFIDQCKELAEKSKRLMDQSKEQKDLFNKQLATRIVDHDLQRGLTAFEQQMTDEYENEDFIKNPCYLLMEAENIIGKLSTWQNKARSCLEVLPWTEKQAATYNDAIACLEKAIKLDPIYTFTAQVNRAYFLIDQEKSTDLYKVKAKEHLVRAQEILGTYILPQLYSMQLDTKKADGEWIHEDLGNQIRLKVEILQVYQSHVSQAIAIIEDSQKLIDVTLLSDDGRATLAKKLYRDEVTEVLDQSSGTISLTFHSLKCHTDVWKHDQAEKLLKVFSKDGETVNVRFLEGSKKNIEELTTIISSTRIQLTVDYLDTNEVLPLLALTSKKVDLKLSTTTDEYQKVLKAINDLVELSESSDQKRKAPKMTSHQKRIIAMNKKIEMITKTHRFPAEASEALQTLEDDATSVESLLFKTIDKELFEFISSQVSKPSFTMVFHSLTNAGLTEIVEQVKKPFHYEVRGMSISDAKNLVKKSTDRNFLLTIEELSVNRAKKIIRSFDRNEQDVATSLKRLVEHFSKADHEYDELNAYKLLGISLLITVDELSPRPWISATIVVALGVGQIIGGVCLAAVTGGLAVSLGISLIGEGINDIVFGLRGAWSRQFSWRDYAIQKGVSLAICFVSLGFSAVVQAVKGAQAVGVTGAASLLQATRQGTVEIFKNSFRTVGTGAVKGISSSSWGLALKQVLVSCAETGVRELANYFADAAYQGVLTEIKSLIRAEIELQVRAHQSEKNYQRIINRALAVDRYYNNEEWRSQTEQIAMDILTKSKDKFVDTIQSLSKGITNAFLNHSRQLADASGGGVTTAIKTTQLLMTVGPILKGAQDIRILVDSFFNQYKRELTMLEEKIPTVDDLLVHASNQELTASATKTIVEALTSKSILTADGLLDARFNDDDNDEDALSNPASFRQAEDGAARTPKDKLLRQLRKVKFETDEERKCAETVLIKMLGGQNQRPFRASMFQKKIIEMLVDQVCSIIYGTMVAPLMNYAISRTVSALSTAAQLAMDPRGTVAEQLMQQGAKRYIHGIANDLVEKYQSGELKVDPAGKEKLDKLIERSENGEAPANMSEDMAMKVKNGGQGGVVELCILAMLTKKPITVLQDQVADGATADDGSIQVVYTPPKRDPATGNVIDGHYELAGGTTATGGTNDCLYTAILSKTQGQFPSVDAMRTQCAAFMLSNPGFIAGIHPALSIINQARDPVHRRELMGEGGAKKVEFKSYEDAKTLTDAKDKLLADAKKFVEEHNPDDVSKGAQKSIKELLEKPAELGNFDRLTSRAEGVVQVDYDIVIEKPGQNPIKMHISFNADEKNEKLQQPDHLGSEMHSSKIDKVATHKCLKPGTLESRRPTERTGPQPTVTRSEPQQIFERKERGGDPKEKVTYTKTVWRW